MKTTERATLLRIYLGESDKHGGRPVYELIVQRALELHLAGATVLRGPMGYGAHNKLHTTKVLRLSESLPLVVEIVDRREKIEALLDALVDVVGDALVTLENVEVLPRGTA